MLSFDRKGMECLVSNKSHWCFCAQVGGKYDNGGRFDLRLPYADQGYVDDDADVMGKLTSFFGGGKKKESKPEPKEEPKKKGGWPW